MAVTLDQTIEQKQKTVWASILGHQTFWVLVAVILACVFLSFATDAFATSKNLYNITRNVTFVAIVALGMTMVIITGGIDLSVGSVLCLCSMVLAVTMHAGWGIEVGIALSGVVLGLMVLLAARPPLWVAAGLVGLFAIFHGHAHGAELPASADPAIYAVGFVVATGLLHLTGIAIGQAGKWPVGRVAVRAAGAVIALAGGAFLTGLA